MRAWFEGGAERVRVNGGASCVRGEDGGGDVRVNGGGGDVRGCRRELHACVFTVKLNACV